MKKRVKIPILFILFGLLVLVRAFSEDIFYDPFINYFKGAYLDQPIPAYSTFKLWSYIFFRYLINAVISLMIIYVAFQKKGLVRFSIKFYTAAFIVLGIVYFALLQFEMINGYLFTFYVRRFLIHPVFVLILLPAFYYQKKLVRAR
jgi:exosortase F-associated protein